MILIFIFFRNMSIFLLVLSVSGCLAMPFLVILMPWFLERNRTTFSGSLE